MSRFGFAVREKTAEKKQGRMFSVLVQPVILAHYAKIRSSGQSIISQRSTTHVKTEEYLLP